MPQVCHRTVRDVAQAACGELYDTLMGDNLMYEMWRKQNPQLSGKQLETRFIAKNWAKCIPFARATLAHMLSRPDVDEKVKEQIHDVLIKESTIPVGGRSRQKAVEILNLSEVAKREGWGP